MRVKIEPEQNNGYKFYYIIKDRSQNFKPKGYARNHEN